MYDSFVSQNQSFAQRISVPEWQGATSQKFKGGKRIFPVNDLIKNGLTMPLQTLQTGRQHYVNQRSPQQEFRRSKRQHRWQEHWHPRASRIRTFDFKPTSPPPRPQKKHVNPTYNPQRRFESVRTSFFQKHKPTKQYFVQDRMQRKVRVDQLQLRRSFYKNLNVFKKPYEF